MNLKIKSILNCIFPKQKATEPDHFQWNFQQVVKEEIISIFKISSTKIEAEGTHSNFYSLRLALFSYQNQRRYYKKTKVQNNMSYKQRYKNFHQNMNKLNQHYIMTIVYHDQVKFIPDIQVQFNIGKSVCVIYNISKLRKKNHMILSIDEEKAFDKILHPFMIKKNSQHTGK